MPKKIALFSCGWAFDLLHDYSKGVVRRMQGHDVDLYMFVCFPPYVDDETQKIGELNIFNLPYIEDFDGVLVLGNAIDHLGVYESLIKRCKDANVPVVSTGRKDENAYFVGSDNYEGAKYLYTHLVETHHIKKPVFIAGNTNNEDSNTRLDTLCEVMRDHGVETDNIEVFYSQWEPKLTVDFIHDKYGDKNVPLPDAFVCANDTLAIAVCLALEEIGYEVPSDTIVTGFDNDYTAEIYSPSITSVDQRFSDLGAYAVRLLLDLIDGNKRNREMYIGCELFQSESCGCKCMRDLDYMRRMQGKRVFYDRMMTTIFERNVTMVEGEMLSGDTFEEFEANMRRAFSSDTTFIGQSFHVVIEPGFRKAMTNLDTKFRTNGYSKIMNAIYSMENGKVMSFPEFESRKLVPYMDPDKKNRVFVFVPIHEVTDNYGYMVFGDNVDIVGNGNHLFEYISRIDVMMSKVRQNISLRVLNKRLIELTETDVLTNVKNRAAYVTKEAELNSLIRSGARLEFGIGLFDINNLKKINDSLGHEAGDAYIVNCCSTMCKVFSRSPVYRIGGDEFVVLLKDDDYRDREELMKKIKLRMEEIAASDPDPEEKVSIAGGIGIFDRKHDEKVADIFARADAAMYEDKQKMKEKMV
ncbi:MAG: substrate-binding domain-containing protein [Lachnospiraceae bacterium]|nr:substrate-binding domain-containing protein [Lachnospiraceae bacterium]